jgi:hypothetical protein
MMSSVCRDRYGQAVTRALPDAKQAADRWHLMRAARSSKPYVDRCARSARRSVPLRSIRRSQTRAERIQSFAVKRPALPFARSPTRERRSRRSCAEPVEADRSFAVTPDSVLLAKPPQLLDDASRDGAAFGSPPLLVRRGGRQTAAAVQHSGEQARGSGRLWCVLRDVVQRVRKLDRRSEPGHRRRSGPRNVLAASCADLGPPRDHARWRNRRFVGRRQEPPHRDVDDLFGHPHPRDVHSESTRMEWHGPRRRR